jgi:hypothetical protein
MTGLTTKQCSHIIHIIFKYFLFKYYYFYNFYIIVYFIKFNQYHVDTCQT